MPKAGIAPEQLDPLRYTGAKKYITPCVNNPRQPTENDNRFPLLQLWLVDENPLTGTEGELWYLAYFKSTGLAQWLPLSTGGSGPLLTILDDNAASIVPNGSGEVTINTQVVASGGVPLIFAKQSANQGDVIVQYATAAGSDVAANAGICHFDNTQFAVSATGFVTLAGGGAAIDAINVDASTGPGTNPVVPDGAGEITVSGAVVANHDVPLETHSRAVNAYNIEVQVAKAVTGAPGVKTGAGVSTYDDALFQVDTDGYVETATTTDADLIIGNTARGTGKIGNLTSTDGSINITYSDPNINLSSNQVPSNGFSNLGFSVSGGVVTILGEGGNALSASNPGYVYINQAGSPYLFTRIKVTANQSFEDRNGTSEIIGNLFGTTAGVTVPNQTPFYIYAVVNDNNDAISFMISRIPGNFASPPASDIGTPSNAIADNEISFFSFEDITVSEYESNPALMIGFVGATKNASDDWAFSVATTSFGLGKYGGRTYFQNPYGQYGANASTIMVANGGTPPTMATVNGFYRIEPWSQMVFYQYFIGQTSSGSGGTGAVNAQITIPYAMRDNSGTISANMGMETVHWRDGSGGNYELATHQIGNGAHVTSFQRHNNANEFIQWGDFGTGDRQLAGMIIYPLKAT